MSRQPYWARCLALSRELGDTATQAEAHYVLGITALVRIELEHASDYLKEAAALQRSSETRLAWPTVQGMGIVEIGRRDFGRRRSYTRRAWRWPGKRETTRGSFALALGALAALHQDEHGQVRTLCAEGLGLQAGGIDPRNHLSPANIGRVGRRRGSPSGWRGCGELPRR